MIINIRCYSCGKPLAHLYESYVERTKTGENPKSVLDDLKLKRFCCRSLFLSHVDLIDTIAKFKKA